MSQKSKLSIFLRGLLGHSLSQFFSIVLSLVTVPLMMHYLGVTKYGIWMVIQSIVSYFSNAQFGLGTLSASLIAGSTDSQRQKAIFWRTVSVLSLIALFATGVVLLLSQKPEWVLFALGKVPSDIAPQATHALLFLTIAYMIRLPFTTIASGFIGLQEVHLERLYVAVLPQLANFSALLLTIFLKKDLLHLALFSGVGSVMISVISALHFWLRHPHLFSEIRRKLPATPTQRELLRGGGFFFIGGITTMIILNTDNIIINSLFGAESVAAYSVTFRLFLISTSLFIILNAAIWPMLGRALAAQDWDWIKKVYSQFFIIYPIMGGLIWVGSLAFIKEALVLWIGNESGYGGFGVVFALGAYSYLSSLVQLHANLLTGFSLPKPYMTIGIIEAVLNLIFSLALAWWLGVAGVAFGTCLATLLSSFWLLPKSVAQNTDSRVVFDTPSFLKHFSICVLPFVALLTFLNYLNLPMALLLGLKIVLVIVHACVSWKFIPQTFKDLLQSRIFGLIKKA